MASDVQRWAESEARQAEAIARAERDALHTEVSALRAALEAAETDAQLCRERLGDERERRRAAEALAVPELTADERASINLARKHVGPPGLYTNRVSELLAIIERLSGSTSTGGPSDG